MTGKKICVLVMEEFFYKEPQIKLKTMGIVQIKAVQ